MDATYVEENSNAGEQLAQRESCSDWSVTKRIIFRFAFVYLVLYNLPFPLNALPLGENIEDFIDTSYNKLWNVPVAWVGTKVFNVNATFQLTGSGDAVYNYVQIFCFAMPAIAVTVAWTLLDRKRRNYELLYSRLCIYLRFSLAAAMISYGAAKVIQSQFAPLALDRLIQPFGDASPMGLLWAFMGASSLYNIFVGAAEMLGGVLLTMRRTALLGALVCIGVMSNVLILNLSYDVPVKLYSAHLLVISVFLILPNLGRLADFLLFNRKTEPEEFRPVFERVWLNRFALILQTVFVLMMVCVSLYSSYDARRNYGDLAEKSPLYGIWNVVEFEVNGELRQPLLTDETRWRRVVFDKTYYLAVQFADDARERYSLELYEETKSMSLLKQGDKNWKGELSYERPDANNLMLEGTFGGQQIRAKLQRVEKNDFRLLNRGFHWVNETPFNR